MVQADTERSETSSRSPGQRRLGRWEGYASVEQLNPDDVKLVLQLILDRLDVDLICEATPDYTAYELRARPTDDREDGRTHSGGSLNQP